METWNGISMIPESQRYLLIEIWTGTSGSYGCRAISTHTSVDSLYNGLLVAF